MHEDTKFGKEGIAYLPLQLIQHGLHRKIGGRENTGFKVIL
jgi:hypothetical protein